jgi:putative ABC transport system permease protein
MAARFPITYLRRDFIICRIWRRINPDVPLAADSSDELLDGYYKPERDRSHLFNIGTGLAALIGCIGLYGMAAFNASRRVREIGMRKVLGASRGQMVRLMLAQFLRPVLLANLIAWPLAWIALQRWLEQFNDVIAMPLWLFPLASLAALLVALVTVAGVAFAAASTEPGKALRHE